MRFVSWTDILEDYLRRF